VSPDPRRRLYPEGARLLAELDEAPLPGDPRFDLDRSRVAASAAAPSWEGPGSCRTVDGEVGGVTCRAYLPVSPQGVVVHTHGGGFVEGGLETHDAVCRELAVSSGWAVVAVDYRLAPEHRFPAAFEDVETVVEAVTAAPSTRREPLLSLVPSGPVALLGDSAGATLVGGVALRERRHRGSEPSRFALQVLVYPDVGDDDVARSPEIERGFGLTPEAVRWYRDAFTPDPGDWEREELSPLRAGSYAGLPPTVVITAELDPLRDGAEEYASRLARAGVPVVCTRYCGVVHGFWRRPGQLQAAAAAVDQVAGTLRRMAPG
jgi:acetyl esterase